MDFGQPSRSIFRGIIESTGRPRMGLVSITLLATIKRVIDTKRLAYNRVCQLFVLQLADKTKLADIRLAENRDISRGCHEVFCFLLCILCKGVYHEIFLIEKVLSKILQLVLSKPPSCQKNAILLQLDRLEVRVVVFKQK